MFIVYTSKFEACRGFCPASFLLSIISIANISAGIEQTINTSNCTNLSINGIFFRYYRHLPVAAIVAGYASEGITII